VGRPEGRYQGVLDGVGRLLAVAQGTQGDGPQPVAVTPDELAEGIGVTVDVARQKIVVACVAERRVVQR
jgi:hypothetical protein